MNFIIRQESINKQIRVASSSSRTWAWVLPRQAHKTGFAALFLGLINDAGDKTLKIAKIDVNYCRYSELA